MRHPNAILKAAAVGCSVLLAGGFVSYRAGAFDWLNPPAPAVEPAVVTPEATASAPAAEPAPATTELVPPAILYSSKSGAIVPPPAPATGASSSPAPILGGSKSITPLIPPPSQSPNPAK